MSYELTISIPVVVVLLVATVSVGNVASEVGFTGGLIWQHPLLL